MNITNLVIFSTWILPNLSLLLQSSQKIQLGVPWNPLGPVTAAGPATVQAVAVAVAAASVAARPPPPPGSSPNEQKFAPRKPKTPSGIAALLHCYSDIYIYIIVNIRIVYIIIYLYIIVNIYI